MPFFADVREPLLVAWLAVLAVQAAYYLVLFVRLAFARIRPDGGGNAPVTVIVCARNELENLRAHLPAVLEQDLDDLKVHVVNDCSWDNTEKALEEYADAYPRLKVITVRENERYRHGKKFALTLGIKSATTEVLLMTDADCRPASPRWARLMTRSIGDRTSIVIGYGAYERRPGLLNRWIRFDTVFNAMQYLSYAIAGIPYMGTGRNLSYKRSLFFTNKGFATHNHLVSGDDDLFVNETGRKDNTVVELHPDAFTVSVPKATFKEWVRQKRRHMSTSNHYKTLHRLMLGMFYATLILGWAGFITLLALSYKPQLVLGAFALRWLVMMAVTGGCMRKLGEMDLLIFTPLFDVVVVCIYPILAIFNAFNKVKAWK